MFFFFKDIFSLISDEKDCCSHRKLGLLLYDMIMV